MFNPRVVLAGSLILGASACPAPVPSGGPSDVGVGPESGPVADVGGATDVVTGGGDASGDGGVVRPASIPNLIDWATVAGIEGGIPARATVCARLTTLDPTGAVDARPAIQAALDACPPDQTVLLPPGTFRVDGSLRMVNRVTLRGAGPATVLRTSAVLLFTDGLGRVNFDVVSGSSAGSSRITLARPPEGLTVGSSFILNELNDPAYVHPYGYEEAATAPLLCTYCDEPDNGTRTRGQMARVTSIAGNVVEFTPALYSSYAPARAPRINYPQANGPLNVRAYAGLEDLAIDPRGGHQLVRLEGVQNCWIRNVTFDVRADSVPAVQGYFAHRVAIVHSTFRGRHPSAQSILSQIHTEGWLVENNIFAEVRLVFLNVGRQGGHVFAYNYVASNSNSTTALVNDSGNHGSHPQFLLFESNKMTKHHADSIHGSSSHYTLFRNHFRGRWSDTTFGAGCIWIDSWNYYYNTVGNVLGLPGMTGWQYESESPRPIDQTMYLYRYGYSGYRPHGSFPMCRSTTLRHGNYDFGRNVVEWSPEIADHTLPPSMYLARRPSWYGSLPWPSIGPDVPGYYTNVLPAEYRFTHDGADPP